MKQNRIQHIHFRCAACLLVALLFSGCAKRDLELRPDSPPSPDEVGYTEIALDWGEDARPHPARFLFYNADGALVREVTGVTGTFKGSLPPGTYRLVVHNEDAGQVEYRGTDRYETAGVYAQETEYAYSLPKFALRSRATRHDAGIPCILEPQTVFAAGACKEFDEIVITAGETTTATIAPVELTCLVSFRFIVRGESSVQSLSGVLTGVSRGILISSGKQDVSSSCAVEFSGVPRDGSSSDYTTQISIFSLLATKESPAGTCMVSVTLTDDAGKPYTGTFDITHTLKDILLDNGGTIPVEIPIEVTLQIKDVGELEATAAPWDNSGWGSGDFN